MGKRARSTAAEVRTPQEPAAVIAASLTVPYGLEMAKMEDLTKQMGSVGISKEGKEKPEGSVYEKTPHQTGSLREVVEQGEPDTVKREGESMLFMKFCECMMNRMNEINRVSGVH